MEKLLEKVKALFGKFQSKSKKVKIAVIAAIVAVIVAIISAIVYSSSNKYDVLFSNLDSKDAQTVINALNDEGIDTKIEGNTIYVPKDSVGKLRLELAPSLTQGSDGYELMDNSSSFGMTDEEFAIKRRRMSEGELEKSIKNFEQVEQARVHIAEPDDSVFVSDKQPGKVSVLLTLKKGQQLTEDQVQAIVSLVSGSTKNTPKENISVIDSEMNELTKDLNDDGQNGVSSGILSKQQQSEKDYEDKLQKAIVELLEPVYGTGKVKAKVNANLDFDSKQTTNTTIDPNKVIVSQETLKELNKNSDGSLSESPVDNNMSNQITDNNGNNESSKEQQKTNYDSGKSEVKTISAPGEVKRLTTSVIVNKDLDAEEEEMLQELIANSIGLNPTNGDQITVKGMQFDTSDADQQKELIDQMNTEAANKKKTMYIIAGGIGAALILGLLVFLLIKRKKKKEEEEEQLLDTLIDDTIIPKEPETFDPIEFEAETKNSHLESEIKRYAKEKPEQVVEIIKSWMNENER